MFLLALLYIAIGIIYIGREIIYINRKKVLGLISVFRVMYSFIYGFLPGIFLLRINNHTTTLHIITANESTYFTNMTIILIISILEYIVLCLAYDGTRNSRYYRREFPVISDNSLKMAISVVIIFGIVSLVMWTRAFGSIWNLMVHADAVRANYSNVSNPVAFMEHFTKVFFAAFFVSFSLFLYEKRNKKRRTYTFFLLIVSLFLSLVVMMCTDARGSIGMIILVAAFYYFNEKIAYNELNVNSAIRKIIIIASLALIAIIASGSVMNKIRTGTMISVGAGNIIDILETEFGYTIQSQVAAVNSLSDNPFQYMIINDTLGGIFSWFPSRFVPFKLPTNLWDYNTQILGSYDSTFSGQAPTDFVTASMYLFGWSGVVIFPALFGWFLKIIETLLRLVRYSPYLMALYAIFSYYCLWWVSHCSLRYTVLQFFGIFLTHIIIMFFHGIFDKKSLIVLDRQIVPSKGEV